MKEKLLVLCVFFNVLVFSAARHTLIVTTEPTIENDKDARIATLPGNPVIYEMDIASNISNRFAKTLVSSYVKNPNNAAQESTFTVILPEKAFISEFVLKIEDKEYKAYVKEKEEAKNIYNEAVQRGQTAGHVAVSARDSNKFTVSVNVEPETKAAFLLTYEELLERKYNQYELVLNIHPGQVIEKFNIEVNINESRPLTFVRTPSLRSGNEIEKNKENLDPSADINIDKSTAVVKFQPDATKQKEFAKGLGTKETEGLSGQFVVQYDVERDPNGGEVLLQDGYFVHFFAPDDLQPLPKHIVFVLDTSGSMGFGSNKIDQLKDAMKNILGQLQSEDVFNIIEFNDETYAWDIESTSRERFTVHDYQNPFSDLKVEKLPSPSPVNTNTIAKATNIVTDFRASGGTNIISSLELALAVVKLNANSENKNVQPIVMFLTDGEPMNGITDTNEITKLVTKLNAENNDVPVYCLSFGQGADKDFLRKLSLKNSGFSRHIYEAADASLQLQNFYKEISSPLLSDIKFKYTDAVNVTKTHYPVIFRGSEIVICGYHNGEADLLQSTTIHGRGYNGPVSLTPIVKRPVSSLERLWAYLTVKQKLEEREISDNKNQLSKEALDLALKYSFVTDVTSLVVVKPNDTQKAEIMDARPDAKKPVGLYGPGLRGPKPTYYSFSSRSGGGSSLQAASIGMPSMAARPLSLNSYHRGGYISSNRGYSPLDGVHGPSGFSSHSSDITIGRPGSPAFDSYYHIPDPPTSTRPIAFTTTTTYSSTSQRNIEAVLDWLAGVLNADRTITIESKKYQLGDNYSSRTHNECPRTPLNTTETGTCTLLKDCSEVFTYLTDFQTYLQYFCPVDNTYAGVCCPKRPQPMP